MSLVNCPKCGKQISDKAVSCPHCGYQFTQPSVESVVVNERKTHSKLVRKFALVIAGIVAVVAMAVLGYLGGTVLFGSPESQSVDSESVNAETPFEEQQAEEVADDSGFESGHASPSRSQYVTVFESLDQDALKLEEREGKLAVLRGEKEIGSIQFGAPDDGFEMLLTTVKEERDAKQDIIVLLAAALLSYNDELTDADEAFGDAGDIYKYGASGGYVYGHQSYEIGSTDGGKNLAVKISRLS